MHKRFKIRLVLIGMLIAQCAFISACSENNSAQKDTTQNKKQKKEIEAAFKPTTRPTIQAILAEHPNASDAERQLLFGKYLLKEYAAINAAKKAGVEFTDAQIFENMQRTMGVQDDVPKDLTPLESAQCFGEQYDKDAVRALLEYAYKDHMPISGLNLFLGLDYEGKSTAIQNKQFRFEFRLNNATQYRPEDKRIFTHAYEFMRTFYTLLGFEGYNLVDYDLPMESEWDVPMVYVEKLGETPQEIEQAIPYSSDYLSLLNKDVEKYREEKKKKYLDVFVESQYEEETYHRVVSGFSFFKQSFLKEAYAPFLVKDRVRYNKGATYIAYGYKLKKNQEFTKENQNAIVIAINETITIPFFGLFINQDKPAQNPILNKVQSVLLGEEYDGEPNMALIAPSNLDKALFTAIYTRIRPLNMHKQTFIDGMLQVMQPCFNVDGEHNGE